MQTVKDINEVFYNIVAAHETLRLFQTNTLEEFNIDQYDIIHFPMLHAQCVRATVEEGATVFNYEVLVGDIVMETQTTKMEDVISDMQMVMQDVIAVLNNTAYAVVTGADDHGLTMPVTCEPFVARFNNLLAGWTADLTIRVPNALELCNAPYNIPD